MLRVCHSLIGFGLTLFCSLVFTVSNAFVKLAADVDTFTIAMFRFAFMAIHVLPINVYYGYPLFPKGVNALLTEIRIMI